MKREKIMDQGIKMKKQHILAQHKEAYDNRKYKTGVICAQATNLVLLRGHITSVIGCIR